MALTQITEKGIKDGEIINADINASAAIAGTKISPDFGSQAISTTNDSVTIGDSIIHSGDTNTKIRFPAADTVTAETGGVERLRISSSGIGIGTTSPLRPLSIGTYGSGNAEIAFGSSTSGVASLLFGDGSSGTDIYRGYVQYNHSQDALLIATQAAERMRLTSDGSLLVGCTSQPSASVAGTAFITESSDRRTGFMSSSSTGEMFLFQFFNPNGGVGSIRTNGSATSFQTSSDYRLKENAVAISDGITRLKTLKPYRFNFKADADTTVDGFFAHEVQSVVPEAISGTKDEVDSDNNPVYQGIDQSKLVPLLIAALQEAVTKIETLETKVAALEAA